MATKKTNVYVSHCVTRRQFLLATPSVTAATLFLASMPGSIEARGAEVAEHPKEKVARLSELTINEPLTIFYPSGELDSLGFVAKIAAPTRWGVGPDSDVVAFNVLCRQGGRDVGKAVKTYRKNCRILSRIVLKIEGDDVYATGRMDLMFIESAPA